MKKQDCIKFGSVNPITDDFKIKSTSSNLKAGGYDLSATFTDDIFGDTRSAWDIGADEYVAAA